MRERRSIDIIDVECVVTCSKIRDDAVSSGERQQETVRDSERQ